MLVILWRFDVQPGHELDFERTYGPEGDWARLFRRGEGYLGTELLREDDSRTRYVTIDRWSSQDSYAAFKERWSDEYQALDQWCAMLTEREIFLGSFSSVVAPLDG